MNTIEKKNILILIGHVSGGGAERVACELSLSLQENNNVHLAVFDGRPTTYKHTSNYYNLNVIKSDSIFGKAKNLIKKIYRVRSLKKELHIDVCISFMDDSNIINILSGTCKKITSIRSVLSAYRSGRLNKIIEKMILERSDAVITLSDYVKDDLEKNFNINPGIIHTIYNPCSMNDIDSVYRSESRKEGSSFRIITAGRIIKAKGQWHLIYAFYELTKCYRDATLIILGDGEKIEELKSIVEELGLVNQVEFKGFIDKPEVEYAKADVFVSTSLWEGFGNVIVEAMSVGLPVICTDCPGGPHEIIDPQYKETINDETYHIADYGILVPAFSMNDINENIDGDKEKILSIAISRIIEDKDLRENLSKNARARATDFTIEKITKMWDDQIRRI